MAVNADHDQISSAVNNLLQNAFKFTRGGSEVRLSACAKDDRVLDRGRGPLWRPRHRQSRTNSFCPSSKATQIPAVSGWAFRYAPKRRNKSWLAAGARYTGQGLRVHHRFASCRGTKIDVFFGARNRASLTTGARAEENVDFRSSARG